MKIRTDFVTNSSSSSFMCLRIDDYDIIEKILRANGTDENRLYKEACNSGEFYKGLNGERVEAAFSESGLAYVGWTLTETDIEEKSLAQLKEEFIKVLEETYSMNIHPNDVVFDYGEIYQ